MQSQQPQKKHFRLAKLEERIAPAHLAVHTVVFPEQAAVPQDAPVAGPTPVAAVNHRVRFDGGQGIIAILIG